MHHRDQPLLIEAGRKKNSAIDPVDPLGEGKVEIGRFVVAIVLDRLSRPRDATFRPELDRVGGQSGLVDDRLAGNDQLMITGHRPLDSLRGTRFSQRGPGRRHHEGVAVVGTEVQNFTGGYEVHVFSFAAECPDRNAPTDRLGESDQVGRDSEPLCCPTDTSRYAGFDLIEYQQRPVLGGDLPNRFQVSGLRHADADVLHDWLDNETRNFATLQDTLECSGIVELDDDDIIDRPLRNPTGLRNRVRRIGRPSHVEWRLVRNHHFVVMTVVAAFDLDNLLSLGSTTGETNCVHRRLGARVGWAPHGQAVALCEQLGKLRIELARRDIERSII